MGNNNSRADLFSLLNPGDVALLQDPGYPSHAGGVYLAGGSIYRMPLLAKHDFLPVLEDIPAEVLAQSKMMVLSYPHNPTTAIAPLALASAKNLSTSTRSKVTAYLKVPQVKFK